MHVFESTLEPGELAVVWLHRGRTAAVHGLSDDEALWLVGTLGVLIGDPNLAAGAERQLTALLEPSAMFLSGADDEHTVALVRTWQEAGRELTRDPHLTAVTDALHFPVVHADALAAERFMRREEALRPALAGTWRSFYAECPPRTWGTSTRIERLVREATSAPVAARALG